ncbi:MAG: FAD-dependent oxidoreductase [Rhodocyclaceae bacterium]|jgi:monoamine oxidase|nr:FAD-dependent oxidoreductase [Rhodocyclaceae bacterium]MCA3136037.1 FAD-dependent oxidoreductase [Rhodocyclaceae bacterium]MCA3146193.1 FAD-dependent oxidoreductase [Rhodocyclaceae bacterium]
MARTPLLYALQRIARAWARDASPGQLVPARRRFLAGGAALGAMAAAPGWAAAAAKAAAPRIAVVGAGLAGLTAAWALRRAGLDCTVYEGAQRVGGRCYSERSAFDQQQVAEHGGEFIDSVHEEIIALCRALGLQLDDVLAAEAPGTAPLTWLDGAAYTPEEATRDFQPVHRVVQRQARALGEDYGYRGASKAARALDGISVAQWIDRHVPGGRASRLGRALDNAYTEEFAADTTWISAVSIVATLAVSEADRFEPYAGSDQRYHVRGGNDHMVARLVAELGSPVTTGTRLMGLERIGGARLRLTLRDAGGERAEAFDRVILALPFSTLQDLNLSRAGFRPLKLRAIRELPMGASTKLQLQFRHRFWNARGNNGVVVMDAAPFHSTWEPTRAQPGEAGILNFWSGGSLAFAAGTGPARSLAPRAADALAQALPGATEAWNGRAIRDAWSDNPWSRGSYAYYPVGYATSVLGIEPEPEGHCHFAGEHTSLQWQGFLNGAVESGLRAAREVLRAVAPRR